MSLSPRLTIAALLLLGACSSAPTIDRKASNKIEETEALAVGEKAWTLLREKRELSKDPEPNQILTQVGSRLAQSFPHKNSKWSFFLLKDKEWTVFSLPGRRIGISEGLFKSLKGIKGPFEAHLAQVLAHQMGHEDSHHSMERISQAMAFQLSETKASELMQNQQHQKTMLALMGLSFFRSERIPYAPSHEMQADRIGLMAAAEAGYPPETAISLWTGLQKTIKKQKKPPSWWLTHPRLRSRLRHLGSLQKEAETRFKESAQPKLGESS